MNDELYIGVLIADPELGFLSEPTEPLYTRVLIPDDGSEVAIGPFEQEYTVYGMIITDASGRIVRVRRLREPAPLSQDEEIAYMPWWSGITLPCDDVSPETLREAARS